MFVIIVNNINVRLEDISRRNIKQNKEKETLGLLSSRIKNNNHV